MPKKPTEPVLEMVALDRVDEPATNPNEMTDEDFAALVNAISSEGFLQPILGQEVPAEGGTFRLRIVDGVHRTRAARVAGLDSVPAVMLPPDYPAEKARLLQIGMNRMRGSLDLTAVAKTLADIESIGGFDLTLSGYPADEIDTLVMALQPVSLDDLLSDDGGGPSANPDLSADEGTDKLYELTVAFSSAADLRKARSVLRKAGGKSKDMAAGFKRLAGME